MRQQVSTLRNCIKPNGWMLFICLVRCCIFICAPPPPPPLLFFIFLFSTSPPPPPVRFSDAQDTELTGCDGAALLRRDLRRRRRERERGQLAPGSHPFARGARRAGAVGAGEGVPERRGEGRLRKRKARAAGGRDLFQDQRELRGSAGAHCAAHRHREREPGDGGAPAGARGARGGRAAPRHPQGGSGSCGATA